MPEEKTITRDQIVNGMYVFQHKIPHSPESDLLYLGQFLLEMKVVHIYMQKPQAASQKDML
eukprot:CAMPEP_0181187648 /NCGR_PEP_ID=MMETSP1096-20121128/10687_1 /TAXON_ID=156174 ORGANISM="Chrysochromulina ericina, Strain CCMP281" /NCGR_SAMPLE_ID=MMETSP1096 /ASSEMBLY_ACC=CAM_ASM_000453 /LENGTH=60 /DNA_ID=CAMNT_0023276641 /DNA_START=434 /DNA_END=613 /DNA_ORIENTATION=+